MQFVTYESWQKTYPGQRFNVGGADPLEIANTDDKLVVVAIWPDAGDGHMVRACRTDGAKSAQGMEAMQSRKPTMDEARARGAEMVEYLYP